MLNPNIHLHQNYMNQPYQQTQKNSSSASKCLTYYYTPMQLNHHELNQQQHQIITTPQKKTNDSTAVINNQTTPMSKTFGSGASSAFKQVQKTPKLGLSQPAAFALENMITRRNSIGSNKDSDILRTPTNFKTVTAASATENLISKLILNKTPQKENIGLQQRSPFFRLRIPSQDEDHQMECVEEGAPSNENKDQSNSFRGSTHQKYLNQSSSDKQNSRTVTEEALSAVEEEDNTHMVDDEEEDEELLLSQLNQIGGAHHSSTSKQQKHKTFEGVPKDWHQTIRVRNPETSRVKLYFKCKYPGCDSVFKKSCNLRDHFRKHTGTRPFKCPFCMKTFTQSGNLGRHLKNVHGTTRDSIPQLLHSSEANN